MSYHAKREALQRTLQPLYTGPIDGILGPRTDAAYQLLRSASDLRILTGDGAWPWTAEIDGDDIVVRNVRATCFGGANDPQDSGDTASGVSTKPPGTIGCALPLDGRMFTGLSKAEHAALDGSPLPKLPWQTLVEITSLPAPNAPSIVTLAPFIDLGPGKRTGNALDLTIASARKYRPKATATNFELLCNYRILGAAKYVV